MAKNGETCKEIECLMTDCLWLLSCYSTFCDIYEKDDDRRNYFQESAPYFFEDLNNILIDYIYISICRITDKPNRGKNDNLTVKYINSVLRKNDLMTEEIENLSEKLHDYQELIVDARNKFIAHLDKRAVLEGRSIGEHSKEDVDNFFRNLKKYMDAVGIAIGFGSGRFTLPESDAAALFDALRQCSPTTSC